MAYKLLTESRDVLRHIFWVLLFAILLSVTSIGFYTEGATALNLTFGLATLAAMTRVFVSYRRSEGRLTTVLRALANLDLSSGLSKGELLQPEFERVRERILRSQAQLQAQMRFLRTMLTHLDTSILVVNDQGRIVHKNPAVDRLLGPLSANVGDPAWGALGEFLRAAEGPCRSVVPWQRGEHHDTLSVHISFSHSQARWVKIVSIQSIRHALEAKEQLAYKRLTRVLTHEVANSIMPLASLADTAKKLLPNSPAFPDEESQSDLEEALQTLATRAEHLDQFIKRFAEMSRLPPPRLQRVELRGLVNSVFALFEETFTHEHIQTELATRSDAQYWVMADAGQIEQVLVNLITNAVEILKEAEEKRIQASIDHNEHDQLVVDIRDSGPGIEPHVRDQIFVPFFTTKPKGSGIGLSLARQIMVSHGGDLLCIAPQGPANKPSGAHFRLVFG